jgi:hypothetical protein
LDTMNATTNHLTFVAVIGWTIAATAKGKP